MIVERSLNTPHRQPSNGPTVPVAMSFGEWMIVLVVCGAISLLVAGAAIFMMARQSDSMPGHDFPMMPDQPPVETGTIMMEQPIAYTHDGTQLEGFLVFDASNDRPRPGVLIVHAWMGIGDNTRARARQLAELGYVAFCADIYGAGIRPETRQEAAAQAGIYRADRSLLRARAQAGLTWLKGHPFVDSTRVAAIGYCFGGGTVLELARSGAELNGVVSFHGNLDTPDPSDAANIKCSVLVAHGAADPHVNQEAVQAFVEEMTAQPHVDWSLTQHGNAVHAFSHGDAGDDTSTGVAYNAKADLRSFQVMLDFFREIFE